MFVFPRSALVPALLLICLPTLVNAADRGRGRVNRMGIGLGEHGFRMEFPRNYVELPLDQTLWVDGTGDWFNPANWSTGVPDESATAKINNGGTAQITSGTAAAAFVELGSATGDVGSLSTSGSGNLQDDGGLNVGEQGAGTLSITAGGVVSSARFVMGDTPGSNGIVAVSGSGSTWNNLVVCFVGYQGSATLNIINGGQVTGESQTSIAESGGSNATVTVDGAGSSWTQFEAITVGGDGTGILNIANGGTVSTLDSNFGGGVIGRNPGSNGTVQVSDVSSSWTNKGLLSISDDGGDGTLHIMAGGFVSSSGGILGSFGGTAEVTIEGAGSTWTNSGDLFVGNDFDGVGMLTVSGGGQLTNFNGFLGFDSSANGAVEVDGTGSTWTNNGNLYIGGTDSGAAGVGVVHIADEGTVNADSVTVWNPGTIGGNGLIQATNGMTIHGTLMPEETLSVDGNLTLSANASTLSTVTPDAADNVIVQGSATVSGNLEVILTGGPFIAGAQYTLLQANAGLNGTTFSDVSITFPPGVDGQVMYDTNRVYLVINQGATPTPSPTPSVTPTPSPTPPLTPTPSVTPTATPRSTPTPRTRPSPRVRPTPPR